MAEIDLNFIARQLAGLITEVRGLRASLRAERGNEVRGLLALLREDRSAPRRVIASGARQLDCHERAPI